MIQYGNHEIVRVGFKFLCQLCGSTTNDETDFWNFECNAELGSGVKTSKHHPAVTGQR